VDTCTFYDIHHVFNHTHGESDPEIMGARKKARVPQLQSPPHTQWKKGDFFKEHDLSHTNYVIVTRYLHQFQGPLVCSFFRKLYSITLQESLYSVAP
jgi:hypothetical protein